MTEWVLVIYIFAGQWSRTDSVTITSVPMATEQICHQAAKDAEPLISKMSFKEIRTVCLRVR